MKKKSLKTSSENKKEVVGFKSEQKDYTVEIKYSQEAIDKKLIRFTPKKGKAFEVTADQMIELLAQNVNQTQLQPVYVDTEKIDMVYVKRQFIGKASKSIPEGEEIRLDYVHPYPLEFAILEEAYNIAQIDTNIPRIPLTFEYIKEIKSKISPKNNDFLKSSYRSLDIPLETKT
jgi:uncharacterized membrane protein YfhO